MKEENHKLRKQQRTGSKKKLRLRSRKTESKTVILVTKASNTFSNTTVNERYQQNNIQSKIPILTWRKTS